jgi:DNA-binding NarL/FixJ family response regulator
LPYAAAVPSSAALLRSRERIVRICVSVRDARTLRLEVLAEIRRAVPFDAYAWLLTDPETAVGSAPLADVPCLPKLPTLIRLKYLTDLNRWTRLNGSVAMLSEASGGDLEQSLVWRELLQRYGVVDIASSVFTDQFGCWGFLDLWRTGNAHLFTPDDEAFLAGIAAPVTTALRRSQAETFIAAVSGEWHQRGPVLVVLSPNLDVMAQTPETQAYLRVLVPPDEDRSPIPANAYNVAAQLLALEAGIDSNPAAVRVHLSGGRWLTLRAARMDDARLVHERDIAVSIEDSSPSERASLFARAYGLSAREAELLGHLVMGNDTRGVARLMFLSQHTVQDHLKSIFTKTSVRNRRTLLARALGT